MYSRNDNEKQVAAKKPDKKQKPEAAMAKTWRDLIPVIKFDVTSVSSLFVTCYFETKPILELHILSHSALGFIHLIVVKLSFHFKFMLILQVPYLLSSRICYQIFESSSTRLC